MRFITNVALPWFAKCRRKARVRVPPTVDQAWNTFLTESDADTLFDALHWEIRKHRAQKHRENNSNGGGDKDDLELNDGDSLLVDDGHIFEQAAMRRGELDDETGYACDITWTKDEEWLTCRQDYSGDNRVSVTDDDLNANLLAQTDPTNLKRVAFEQLNAKQRIAFLVARRALSPNATPEQKCMLFLGGGGIGKSQSIYSVLTAMKDNGEKFLVTATTGKAATVISGSTSHSKRDGLGIPTEAASYKELEGDQYKGMTVFVNSLERKG
jgi:hypothetical protein